ncbi:hypothetical protein [Sulfobacillus thermosulfidooxidans]|uniref:hypothetical protein n=1 Tax=Sulfobacillus thermosulfidooxidans TaxID=28034 RepID=UPI0002DB3A15|nr:hypothetical protein [Sulfobacillus thermosulfidooxidans]
MNEITRVSNHSAILAARPEDLFTIVADVSCHHLLFPRVMSHPRHIIWQKDNAVLTWVDVTREGLYDGVGLAKFVFIPKSHIFEYVITTSFGDEPQVGKRGPATYDFIPCSEGTEVRVRSEWIFPIAQDEIFSQHHLDHAWIEFFENLGDIAHAGLLRQS